jgi:hypothetical protein
VAELQRKDKELDRAFRESLKEAAVAPLEPDVLKLLTSLFKRRSTPSGGSVLSEQSRGRGEPREVMALDPFSSAPVAVPPSEAELRVEERRELMQVRQDPSPLARPSRPLPGSCMGPFGRVVFPSPTSYTRCRSCCVFGVLHGSTGFLPLPWGFAAPEQAGLPRVL